MTLATLVFTFVFGPLQDTPTEIAKAELPKEAVCAVCEANGTGHGPERPVAGFTYKGVSFYFCDKSEVDAFKKDPDSYLPPVLPRPAPEFALTDMAGKKWAVGSEAKGLTLVDFWATWCKPCKETKPILDELRKAHLQQGFEVLSVSIDESRAVLEKHLAKNKFQNPVLFDDKQTWATWRVRVVPTFFLVKDGQIVGQWSGKVSKGTLEAAIVKALAK